MTKLEKPGHGDHLDYCHGFLRERSKWRVTYPSRTGRTAQRPHTMVHVVWLCQSFPHFQLPDTNVR